MRISARSGEAEYDALQIDRRGEEPLVAPNLGQRLAVGEREEEEAAIGGVEETETVEAWLDLEVRTDLAVDEDAVGAELGDPRVLWVAGDVVEDLTVDASCGRRDEGNLVLAAGKVRASSRGLGSGTCRKRPA
jgi:hypothetical protein